MATPDYTPLASYSYIRNPQSSDLKQESDAAGELENIPIVVWRARQTLGLDRAHRKTQTIADASIASYSYRVSIYKLLSR